MKKISNIFIQEQNVSATFANTYNNSLLATPSIPAHFDGWAFSIDGLLYKTFTNSDSQTVQFDSSASSQQKVYLRGLRVINNEEILDDTVVEKNVTIQSGDGEVLFFHGGFAYTVPRKPTSYSWTHNGAISGSINGEKKGALSIWFKPSGIPSDHEIYNGGRMYLLSKRTGREWGDWALSFNFSNGIHFYQYTLGSGTSYINQYFGGNIQLDQWHHVLISHNRSYSSNTSYIHIYLNGKYLSTQSTVKIKDQPLSYMAIGTRVTHMRSSSTQFHTGYAASDSRFYGYMKDYWFTDYTIPSSSTVATMYNNGEFNKPPFTGYNPYSAHWPLTANNGYIGGSTNRFTNRFIIGDGRTFKLGNGNLQSVSQIKYTDGVTPI